MKASTRSDAASFPMSVPLLFSYLWLFNTCWEVLRELNIWNGKKKNQIPLLNNSHGNLQSEKPAKKTKDIWDCNSTFSLITQTHKTSHVSSGELRIHIFRCQQNNWRHNSEATLGYQLSLYRAAAPLLTTDNSFSLQ